MKRISLLPVPSFSIIQYPFIPPNAGLMLSSGSMRKLGCKLLKEIVKEIESSSFDFEDLEEVQIAIIRIIEDEQIWLIKSVHNDEKVLTLMLSSEF